MAGDSHFGIFWVTKQDFIALVLGWGDRWLKPLALNIPKDAKVVDVCYDWQRDSFGIKLEHPDFPVTQPGDVVPWVGRLELGTSAESPSELVNEVAVAIDEWRRVADSGCLPCSEKMTVHSNLNDFSCPKCGGKTLKELNCDGKWAWGICLCGEKYDFGTKVGMPVSKTPLYSQDGNSVIGTRVVVSATAERGADSSQMWCSCVEWFEDKSDKVPTGRVLLWRGMGRMALEECPKCFGTGRPQPDMSAAVCDNLLGGGVIKAATEAVSQLADRACPSCGNSLPFKPLVTKYGVSVCSPKCGAELKLRKSKGE